MKRLFLISLLFLIALLTIGATTARFERYFRDASGAVTGATIYIVNYSTSESYELTEVNSTTKPGLYRREGVPHGLYQVVVNGVLTQDSLWFGATKLSTIADNFNNSGEIATTGIQDAAVTLPKLSNTVRALIDAGAKGTYAPDDVTLEFKIAEDTTIAVKAAGLDTTYFSQATNRSLYNSRQTDGKYGYRKTVDYAGLKECIYANTASGKSGYILGEANYTETISNEGPIMVASNTTIHLPKSYKIDFFLTAGVVDSQGVFRLNGVENVIIDGGEFVGNAVHNGVMNEHLHAFTIVNSKNVTIRNAYIHDFAGDGVNIIGDDCENITVENCTIDIPNIRYSDPLVGRDALSVISGKKIYFLNNTLRGGWPGAIDFEPNSAADESHTIEDFIIQGNIIYGANKGYGISINCGQQSVGHTTIIRRGLIKNNFIMNTYLAGIDLAKYTHAGATTVYEDITVDGNYLYNCGEEASASASILVKGSTNKITNNHIVNSLKHGILVSGETATDNIISYNTIENSQLAGIWLSAGSGTELKRYSIVGNTIRNNSQITTNTWDGIICQYTDFLNIKENFIYSTTAKKQRYGINIDSCDSLYIADNFCFGSTTSDAIQINGGSAVTKGFNRAGITLDYGDIGDIIIRKDGSAKMDSAWHWIISSDNNDLIPAITTNLLKSEIHANRVEDASSDRGFMRLSAGGGGVAYRKAAIDLQGYAGTIDSTQVRLYAGENYGLQILRYKAVAPLGIQIGTNGTEIDSAKVVSTNLLFYAGGNTYSMNTGGPFLPIAGGTMTGNLLMNSYSISNDGTAGDGLTFEADGDVIANKKFGVAMSPVRALDVTGTAGISSTLTMGGNIIIGTKYISGDGDNEGLSVATTGMGNFNNTLSVDQPNRSTGVTFWLRNTGTNPAYAGGLGFKAYNGLQELHDFGYIFMTVTDTTHDSEDANLEFWGILNGTIAKRLTLFGTGKLSLTNNLIMGAYQISNDDTAGDGLTFHTNGNIQIGANEITSDGTDGDGINIEADGDVIANKKFGVAMSPVRALDVTGTAGISSTLTMGGNIILGANYLSGDGGNEGISIDAGGSVWVSTALTMGGAIIVGANQISNDNGPGDGLTFAANGDVTAGANFFADIDGKLTKVDSLYSDRGVSALSYTDRCNFYKGNATDALLGIKGKDEIGKNGFVELDHKSLPLEIYQKTIHKKYKDKQTGKELNFIDPDSLQNYIVLEYEEEGRNLSKLIDVLVKGFQEQQAEIADLKKEIEKLTSKELRFD